MFVIVCCHFNEFAENMFESKLPWILHWIHISLMKLFPSCEYDIWYVWMFYRASLRDNSMGWLVQLRRRAPCAYMWNLFRQLELFFQRFYRTSQRNTYSSSLKYLFVYLNIPSTNRVNMNASENICIPKACNTTIYVHLCFFERFAIV